LTKPAVILPSGRVMTAHEIEIVIRMARDHPALAHRVHAIELILTELVEELHAELARHRLPWWRRLIG
jgi:hypothetical protein